MTFSQQDLQAYCKEHSTPPGNVLHAIERETHLKTLAPQMLCGPWLGKLLQMISIMIQPTYVLEIGSFTGYSGICLAHGLKQDGIIHMIEANPELESMIRRNLVKAGLEERAQLHIGTAEEIVVNLDMVFDLVFIDAGKHDNRKHYEMVLPLVRQDGMILVDNTLWDGKVLAPHQDADTMAIHAFNTSLREDPRVEQVLLPIRDGLTLIRKL